MRTSGQNTQLLCRLGLVSA